jgi:hypothetical protein
VIGGAWVSRDISRPAQKLGSAEREEHLREGEERLRAPRVEAAR